MGEIKSTLDLIMEKSKNLTMSEEEKKIFKEQEIARKVKGLVQRRLDALITGERFREEVAWLQKESREEEMVGRLLKRELIGCIELCRDNQPFLDLLERELGQDPESVKKILQEYDGKAARLLESRMDELKEKLERREISGSAVVPNIESDQEWNEGIQRLQDELRVALSANSGKNI